MSGGAAGTFARVSHDEVGVTISTIKLDLSDFATTGFGSGDDANPTATASATLIDPLPYTWELRNSAGAITGAPDDTLQAGAYFLVGCGFIDLDGSLTWAQGTENANVIAESFLIFATVGGASIPISSTSNASLIRYVPI